jgi:hypothetical protein
MPPNPDGPRVDANPIKREVDQQLSKPLAGGQNAFDPICISSDEDEDEDEAGQFGADNEDEADQIGADNEDEDEADQIGADNEDEDEAGQFGADNEDEDEADQIGADKDKDEDEGEDEDQPVGDEADVSVAMQVDTSPTPGSKRDSDAADQSKSPSSGVPLLNAIIQETRMADAAIDGSKLNETLPSKRQSDEQSKQRTRRHKPNADKAADKDEAGQFGDEADVSVAMQVDTSPDALPASARRSTRSTRGRPAGRLIQDK